MSQTRDLRVKITKAEKLAKGDAMALAFHDAERLEVEAKTKAADYKGQIADKKKRAKELGEDIRLNSERRSVECVEERDYDRSHVRLLRADTGEEVDSWKMTEQETQQKLGLDDDVVLRDAQEDLPLEKREGSAPPHIGEVWKRNEPGDGNLLWAKVLGTDHGKKGDTHMVLVQWGARHGTNEWKWSNRKSAIALETFTADYSFACLASKVVGTTP